MFPKQEVNLDNLTSSNNEISTTGKSFLFDFDNGDFVLQNGKIVEVSGYDALKVWIEKVLRTIKTKYKIYDSNYGIVNLKELITQDFPFAYVKAEIEREVNETLLKNSEIKSVTNFEFVRDGTKLTVSFTVSSIYGTTESGVII